MKRFALKYLFLRTASSAAGLIIIIVNFVSWDLYPEDIPYISSETLLLAVLFGFQTFMFFYLGFLIADSISRFWWSRWRTVETSALTESSITVPGDHVIPGKLYQLSSTMNESVPGKLIIVSYGINDNQFRAQHIAKALAALGYRVFTWDYRGRDESKGKITDLLGHVQDLRTLIEFWSNNSLVDAGEVYLCGWSLGGMVSIIAGLADDRVRKLFVWSTWSDLRRRVLWRVYVNPLVVLRYLFKGELLYVSRKTNEEVSPVHYARNLEREKGGREYLEMLVKSKLFMCHAKNDSIIGFDNFKENASALHLPQTNQFVFKKGSHMVIRKETIIVGLLSRFFTEA
ncbi:MAG TPA: alpha/beta fold hydrolase [Candidatus Lokiarchaeia archaeon]|nr:alpha/beta fold hydrolase [Candidatus Lokiarchaeia archaeon]